MKNSALRIYFCYPAKKNPLDSQLWKRWLAKFPVIASNVGGLPEVVTDGVDGYLISPHDVETGAERALEILTRPDRGRSMGQKARVNARAKYCANDVIPMYEAYYRRVLQLQQNSPPDAVIRFDDRHGLQRLRDRVDVVLRDFAANCAGGREDEPELVVAVIEFARTATGTFLSGSPN